VLALVKDLEIFLENFGYVEVKFFSKVLEKCRTFKRRSLSSWRLPTSEDVFALYPVTSTTIFHLLKTSFDRKIYKAAIIKVQKGYFFISRQTNGNRTN
jgi:hypothetical protein